MKLMSSCRMGEGTFRDARVTGEFEVRRVEELADVLRCMVLVIGWYIEVMRELHMR